MAATDVISLARAKAFLTIAGTDPTADVRLQAYISSISQQMDEHCGPVIGRTVTERLDGSPMMGDGFIHWPQWQATLWPTRRAVQTSLSPVLSVTSITEYTEQTSNVLTAETNGVAGDYLLEPWQGSLATTGLYSGTIYRRRAFADSYWQSGRGNVVVVYTAGRYANTAAAQDTKFEQAAATWLRFMWSEQNSNVGPVGQFTTPYPAYPAQMPNVVKQILFGEWKSAVFA